MGTEYYRCIIGHIIQFFDKNCTQARQPIDHEAVMHNFMPDIDRCTEKLQRTLDDLNRPVNTGTETTGIGELDVHHSADARFSAIVCNRLSSNNRITPQVIAESATLKAGQCQPLA